MRQVKGIRVLFIAFASFACLISANAVSGDERFEKKLDLRLDHFDSEGRTLIQNVLDLAYRYELPSGIEYIDKRALNQPIQRKFENASVREILEDLVLQTPGYQVDFSHGIVDVFVPSERSNPSNLLNQVIPEFKVTAQDTDAANVELTCALVYKLNPSDSCTSSAPNGQFGSSRITLHLQNAKIYEIVNAIVAQNGKAAWTVIAPPSSLTDAHFSDLWHIYSLRPPFKEAILGKLSSLKL
jgi:hypothetical protein